jgi:hypothetical protein
VLNLDADIRAALDLADLGTPAVWSVGAKAVQVVFDNAHELVGLAGVGISSTNPRAQAIAADLPGVAVGQTLVIGAVTYTIRDVQPDGEGLVALELQAP